MWRDSSWALETEEETLSGVPSAEEEALSGVSSAVESDRFPSLLKEDELDQFAASVSWGDEPATGDVSVAESLEAPPTLSDSFISACFSIRKLFRGVIKYGKMEKESTMVKSPWILLCCDGGRVNHPEERPAVHV